MRYTLVPTPLGDLLALVKPVPAKAGSDALARLAFDASPPHDARRDDAGLRAVREQLAAFFARELDAFDLDLAPAGTPFQRRVWTALADVPFGQTTTYGALARQLGDPGAAQAVGAANGANPLAIVVPCHRVVGSGGALVGYAGGLHRKRALLDLERGQSSLFA